MKYFLSVMTLFLFSCAKNTYQVGSNVYLPTTTSELKAKLGNPASVQAVPDQPNAQLLNYDNGTYQVKDSQVTALLAKPTGAEAKLQFWLQKWQKQKYSVTTLEFAHGVPKTQVYKNADSKTAVIYSISQDEVQKVIYEK